MTPRFSLRVGALRSSTVEPVGAPERIVVERDMDRVDALRLWFGAAVTTTVDDQAEVALDDETVFTGTVTAVRPTLTGTEVLALGTSLALLRLRAPAGYERRDAGAIVRDLADRAGMATGTVEPGAVLPADYLDGAVSAYHHARALADRFGFELYTDRRGRLMFHAPRPTATTAYAHGRDLLAAEGTVRATWLEPVVGGEGHMSEGGESSAHWLSSADLTGGTGDRLVLDPLARTQDLADRFAQGYATTWRRGLRRTRLRVPGNARIDMGQWVRVTGEQPVGSGYVRAVRHTVGARTGWVTELTVQGES
jgi:hypothetical protein